MNNEQNNNIFGGITPIPPVEPNGTPTNSVPNGVPSSITSIPGANLTPIGGIVSETSSTQPIFVASSANEPNLGMQTTIPMTPVPGIVENSNVPNISENNNMTSVPLTPPNQEVLSVNSNSVVPSDSTSIKELKPETSSPFDIGLGNFNMNQNLTNNSNQNIETNISSSPASQLELLTPAVPNNGNDTNPIPENNPFNNVSNTTLPNNNKVPLTNTFPANAPASDGNIVSVGKYLGTIILFSIPVVGTIMLIVKAVGDKKDKNITNLARAYLLLAAILCVVSVIIAVAFGGILMEIASDSDNSIPTNTYYDYNLG